MRSLLLTLVLGWFFALSGCARDRPPALGTFELDGYVPLDAADDLARQTFDIVPVDIPVRDIPPADVPVAVGMNCHSDSECAFGARCLQGRCALDTCRTTDNPCGPDARCDMRCVPTRDLCDGVPCGNNQTCFLGQCTPGCFPAPCSGISCPAGQFCDDTTGGCAPIVPCTGACQADYACHVQCLPRSNCDGVQCEPTEVCADGRCVPNPCAGVTCATGSLCVAGRCVDTCACNPPCNRSSRDRCVVGQCQCARNCVAGGACGADDGCGGRCVGACSNPFSVCDALTATCNCTPRCTADTPCGDPDGCGGTCNEGGCMPGFSCDATRRTCVCMPHCPPVEEFANVACGQSVPNLCEGGPSCGTGTRCAMMGQHCNEMGRCVADEEPPDGGMEDGGGMNDGGDGGGGCPGGRTDCGGSCIDLQTNRNHCGACDNRCPAETTCTAGVCTCPGTGTLCDGRCVNTQSENSHCGACGNACPALSSCTGGMCSCVPHCDTDPSLVECGMDVPNACPGGPACGRGTRCASGSLCDPMTRRCVCIPLCPPGVRCGVSDGCGGTCIGSCNTGEACARDPMDETRYFCSSAGCVGGCACNEVCSMNRCVAVTCANGTSPCPCQCCPVGQRCVGGSACMPIPP